MLALVGALRMLRSLPGDADRFRQGVRMVRTACSIGVVVYALFFFAIGGDWFLAWQNPELGGLQRDAVNYGVIIILPYIVLDSHLQKV